ncbi:MAG: acyltransferase [Nitrospirales bacterium]|nr:MAG: acyltransferase [Nitrospirales bacterium]
MSAGWLRQRERGSRLAYRLMTWIALRLGRPIARLLLYPISMYFVVFSRQASQGLRIYLQRVLQRPPVKRDLFRHYHCFASTILDRTYLLAKQYYHFSLNFHNAEVLLDRVDREQGCLLLGSHLGSFEVVRASGLSSRHVDIRLLMHEENAPILNEIFNKLDPTMAEAIIPVGEPDTMLHVKDCVDKGGLVGILGDRLLKDDKVVSCTFLGYPAKFPGGPMLLASIMKVPVILFFGLYRGENRYDIFFELLAEQVTLDRHTRQQDIQNWTQKYVARLEHHCQIAPHNWFNFYDFWDEEHSGHQPKQY